MAEAVKTDRQKRPYQKPAFEREDLFETQALTCAYSNKNPGQASCFKGGKS